MANESLYESIASRKVIPLYSSINDVGTAVTNKFWFLAWKEIYLLGGTEIITSVVYEGPQADEFIATRIEDNEPSAYWFRDVFGYRGNNSFVDSTGKCIGEESLWARANIRPAFQISL